MKKIGLTLGGGGAKGFAHIPILEVFDELGIKPCCITGSSVGAVLGALYASGQSAKDLVALIHELIIPQNATLKDLIRNKGTLKILDLIDPHISLKPQGLLKGDKLLGYVCKRMQASTFEELEIPLKTVSTDYWRHEQVVADSGPLFSALRASMAIPYIFTPVVEADRVLVDGGLTNSVPHDLLDPKCDIRIAVNIMGTTSNAMNKPPSPREAIFHTYQVMMAAMALEKRRNDPVDIYLEPPLVNIDMLDFHKPWEIYKQGLKAKDGFKRQLDALLSGKPKTDWLRRKDAD
ncbi:patatin-like phospholipase family protein [Pontiella sulfatireligans]|uniref:Putative NTE family protein n=1 Tax=Pontiella sulfatireligans TaxID=2750658 RepID=A0A6C2ULX6_9BACT|nr:patatin-like phospholipase family protein [Pontiella sulfatireligans]VGO21270.1 putative NTE family protein [Pontiella sulfatireligans]